MEEHKINHILQPRKLNLNVPPLSTRRPGSVDPSNDMLMLSVSNNMVPFSWERIPGEPKHRPTNKDHVDLPPTPKPPPGYYWRRQPPGETNHCDGSDVDPGDNEDGHNERFSDAIDIFSLAESSDDMEANFRATKGRNSAMHVAPNNGYCSPNFIIQRFLPDAEALAEASVMNQKLSYSSSPEPSSSFSRAVSFRRSNHSTSKGCGLGSFWPWRMRTKTCSVKSPIYDTIIGTNLNKKR